MSLRAGPARAQAWIRGLLERVEEMVQESDSEESPERCDARPHQVLVAVYPVE